MKHIFMGQIHYKNYKLTFAYKNRFNPFRIDVVIEDINKIKENIDCLKLCRIKLKTEKIEYKIIKETEEITERILENSKVKINDEELIVEKVVQCDNGDVICYTNNIIKKIIDEESKIITEELKNEYEKLHKEYIEKAIQERQMLENQEQNKNIINKKWWQFWR